MSIARYIISIYNYIQIEARRYSNREEKPKLQAQRIVSLMHIINAYYSFDRFRRITELCQENASTDFSFLKKKKKKAELSRYHDFPQCKLRVSTSQPWKKGTLLLEYADFFFFFLAHFGLNTHHHNAPHYIELCRFPVFLKFKHESWWPPKKYCSPLIHYKMLQSNLQLDQPWQQSQSWNPIWRNPIQRWISLL